MKNIEVVVSRPVAVGIKDLTISDLRSFDADQLVEISVGLQELLKEQAIPKVAPEVRSPVKSHPVAEPSIIPHPIEDVTKSVAVARVGMNRVVGKDGPNIGFKYGKTSKYHYVCYNKQVKVNPWNAVVKIKGKNQSKFFATEIEAALAIDNKLDFLQDEKRPRNRIEFPEVMAAYTIQQQQEVK